MTLKIEITCEPHQLAFHLSALQGALSIANPRNFDDDAKDAAALVVPKFATDRQYMTSTEIRQKVEDLGHTAVQKKADEEVKARIAEIVEELANDEPKVEPFVEQPVARRRGRPPKNEHDKVEADKPAISTGAERVSPQDVADEKAESEAKKDDAALTIEDVRRHVKRYGDHFGHEAAMTDIRALIGSSISELKTDYDSLHKAIVAISDAVHHNKRPNGEAAPAKAEPIAPVVVEAAPVVEKAKPEPEPESLFGGIAKPADPPPVLRATPDEVNAAGRAYCDAYDGKDKPFKECPNFLADITSIVTKLFGDKVKTLRDIDALPGDRAEHYGRLREALLNAVSTNPYGRTRI
jgi:hypothetical protein